MRTFLLLTLLLPCFAAADVHRTEWYAKMPFWESPIQAFRGESPLTQAQAKKRIHIQVGYDRHNRIVEILTKLGEQYKTQRSLYVHAEHTKIEHTDKQAIHRFYDRFGNQIAVLGEVWEKRYDKDQHGRYTKMTFHDRQGKSVDNQYGYNRYEWQYSGDGSVIENRFSLKGETKPHRPGFEFGRIRLHFGANGHLQLMQNIDAQGKLTPSKSGASQYRYFYTPSGAFLRWEVLDEQGNPATGPTGTAGEDYLFDESGWHTIAFFNTEYQPDYHASGAVHWHAARDKYGNLIKRWFTDAKQQKIIAKYGYHRVEYVYDDSGIHLLEERYYDINDKLINNRDGVAITRYSRDEKGLLTQMSYVDANGKPALNQWRKFAVEKYSYNDKGLRTKTVKFDAAGTQL